jgi:hypothetical protein
MRTVSRRAARITMPVDFNWTSTKDSTAAVQVFGVLPSFVSNV